jgi:hypothetical protein
MPAVGDVVELLEQGVDLGGRQLGVLLVHQPGAG